MHWTGSMRSPRLCEARWRWLNSSVQNNTTSPLLPGGEQELLVLPAPVFHSPIAADPEPMSRFMLPGVLSARAHAPCLTQPRVGHGPEVDSHAVWHTLSPSQPPHFILFTVTDPESVSMLIMTRGPRRQRSGATEEVTGAVSTCELSVADTADSLDAQGWHDDVTPSGQRRDGGDRVFHFFSPTFWVQRLNSRAPGSREISALECPTLRCFFATPAEREGECSPSRRSGDPPSHQAIDSEPVSLSHVARRFVSLAS